jgi:phage gpG-like protein
VALIDVTVDTSEVVDRLVEYRKRGGNLSPVMAVIAEDLVSAVSDMYDSEGQGQWPPHAESTIAKRRAGGVGAKLMQDSGNLAGSTEPNAGSNFAEATTGVEYIVYHLDGGDIIPQRNPFLLGDEVLGAAVDDVLDYIVNGRVG